MLLSVLFSSTAGSVALYAVCYGGTTELTKVHKSTESTISTQFVNLYGKRYASPFAGYSFKGMVFHQDSASGHTAKHTIQCIKANIVKSISPRDWMPKLPDTVTMYLF